MKVYAILLTLLFISVHGVAQDEGGSNVTNVSKITFLNLGASYEKALGKNSTLYGQLFMNLAAEFEIDDVMIDATYYYDPAVSLQYRRYYNASRRQKKGKRTELNSMNYLAAALELVYSKQPLPQFFSVQDNRRIINKIGVVWGFQRNYNKRFSIDLNIGPALLFANEGTTDYYGNTIYAVEGSFTLISQINLGFWLNRRL